MPLPGPDPPRSPGAVTRFQTALIEWFRREGEDYPWRRTTDPYAILVSEVMLQQTQIATVLEYYTRWMERFPTAAALAKAAEESVLRQWEGLGYYSRARNLHKAARALVDGHGGEFPRTPEGIESLPGVGRYTAGAVATFAFDAPAPIVDANIARVLARVFNYRRRADTPAGGRFLWKTAARLVPRTEARIYNSGLMELGQKVCASGTPACAKCPVRGCCAGAGRNPEDLPKKKPRPRTVLVDEHVLWIPRDGEILLHQETGGRRRRGLWKLPEIDATRAGELTLLLETRYSITHHRVTLRVYRPGRDQAPISGAAWVPVGDVETLPMASPYRRAATRLLNR